MSAFNFPEKTMIFQDSSTTSLSTQSPLSAVTNHLFSISRNGRTFNFRIDIQSVSGKSNDNPFNMLGTAGKFVKEKATIFLLGSNQGEEQVVANYTHSYGYSSNTSSFYGQIVGQEEGQSNQSFESGSYLNFANSIRTHFESHWDSSSITGKSCIIV